MLDHNLVHSISHIYYERLIKEYFLDEFDEKENKNACGSLIK